MELTPEIKEQIDRLNICQMLSRWRFGRVGDPIFQGEIGVYFSDRMFRLREEDPDAWVRASKELGW